MMEKKLTKLFAAARNLSAPAPSAEFAADVMRVAQREPRPGLAASGSIWEHLNGWFPRLALTAAAVILLCLAADWGVTAAGLPGISDGAAQVTSQYLFNAEDL